MQTSERGQRFIKSFEDKSNKAYPDPKSGGYPWTCGWGSTKGVTPDTEWTDEECERRFLLDLAEAENCVHRYVKHEMTQGQFDAFVSIFYNVGPGSPTKDGIGRLSNGNPSTLLRRFNNGDIGGAESEWMRWVSPGSNVERGLRRRRMGELRMFRGEPE